MSLRMLLVLFVAGALPGVLVFAACSPDSTYRGGGRQGDPYSNGTLQVLDSGPDGPPDSGVADTGGPDNQS